MGRVVVFDLPVDTSLFTPLQVQPRTFFWLGMSGWARWLKEHWISFPRLLREQGIGVVIAGLDIEYLRPFGFFDADLIVSTIALRIREDGALFFVEGQFAPPEGEVFARGSAVLRPVRIDDGFALAATPKSLGQEILGRFSGDEIAPKVPARPIPALLAEIEAAAPIATGSRPFTIHRHLVEVADQWSAIAIPDLAAAGRDEIVSSQSAKIPALRAGLAEPMRRCVVEFRRAAFFLDRGTIETKAFARPEGLSFVHRFVCSEGDDSPYATVVERF